MIALKPAAPPVDLAGVPLALARALSAVHAALAIGVPADGEEQNQGRDRDPHSSNPIKLVRHFALLYPRRRPYERVFRVCPLLPLPVTAGFDQNRSSQHVVAN